MADSSWRIIRASTQSDNGERAEARSAFGRHHVSIHLDRPGLLDAIGSCPGPERVNPAFPSSPEHRDVSRGCDTFREWLSHEPLSPLRPLPPSPTGQVG